MLFFPGSPFRGRVSHQIQRHLLSSLPAARAIQQCASWRTKGRKNRTTPLTVATATVLESYLHERATRPGQALFPGPRGDALSADAVQHRLALHIRRAAASSPGLAGKHVTVHTLRHTAAMRFLEAGIDTAVIALWLGHETITTTSIYLHADMNLKRAALDRTRQPDTPVGDYRPPTR